MKKSVKYLDELTTTALIDCVNAKFSKIKMKLDYGTINYLRKLGEPLSKMKWDKKITAKTKKKIEKLLSTKIASKKPKSRTQNKGEKIFARKMVEVVKRYQERNANSEYADEFNMIGMFLNDCADLLELGCHLHEGNIHKSRDIAANVDTAVRDEIPESIYDYMSDTCGD